MPYKSARPCVMPGCKHIAKSGNYCNEHKAVAQSRGTAAQRGYGYNWQRFRKMYLREHPLCVDPFNVHGDAPALATDVDHIKRKRDGGTDDTSNLQSLCHSCHSRKTRGERGEGEAKSLAGDVPRPHVGHTRTPAKLDFSQK